MTETPYVAVLQLAPPQTEGRLHITVTLHATDTVGTGANAKPLRDCTLAELQQFADELEQSFWADHRDHSLQALLDDETVTLAMQLEDGDETPLAIDDLLAASIVLTDEDDTVDPELEPETPVEADVADASAEPLLLDAVATDAPESEQEPTEVAPPKPIVTVVDSNDPEPEPEPEPIGDDSAETDRVEVTETDDSAEPVIEPAPVTPEAPPIRVAGVVRGGAMAQYDAVDIMLDETAMRAMQVHALSSMRREVAGVMLGPQPEKQPSGRYIVRVTDSIIAKHTRMSGASVTYTPESWRYVNDRLAEMYPDGDTVIVGWYHTHPGFGIFLSGMDLFIHENFFTQPWHIAYVLDPVAQRSGFFCWDRLQKRVKEYDLPWPVWARRSW